MKNDINNELKDILQTIHLEFHKKCFFDRFSETRK